MTPRSRRAARRRSQAGITLVETLVALAVSSIIIGPVGAWMMLVFTTQAPAAAGFTDAGQSRLLNTYVTRDISSAEIIFADGDLPPTGTLLTCDGSGTAVMNLYDRALPRRVISYVVDDGPSGTTSLFRRECRLDAGLGLADEAEVVRGLDVATATCAATVPCRTATVAVTLDSGFTTSATASRRGSAASLLGFNGSFPPVAWITEGVRLEREPGKALRVGLSAANSYDPDDPSGMTFSWTITKGPPTALVTPDATDPALAVFSASAAGTYEIRLDVKDPVGNVGSTTIEIPLVNKVPVVVSPLTCSVPDPAAPRTVTCSVGVEDGDTDEAITPQWRFPTDNVGSTTGWQTTGTHTFGPQLTATPVVDMLAEDAEGGQTIRSIQVSIGAPPSGSIEIQPAPVGVAGLLQRAATTAGPATVTFSTTEEPTFERWELRELVDDVPGAVLATWPDLAWSYQFAANASGEFRIVRVGKGVGDQFEDFRVSRPPTAAFVPPSTPNPAPQTLVLSDASSDDFGGLRDWIWDVTLIPGQPPVRLEGESVPFQFPNPGSYSVSLTVTDVDGLTASVSHAVTVGGTPARPAPPTWSSTQPGLITFAPVAGATGYTIRLTYSGTTGGARCLKTVDRAVPAAGPFQITDAGNDCEVDDSTEATLRVNANSTSSQFSDVAVRP